MPARVLTVGNCDFDNSTLATYLRENFNAEMDTADSQSDALPRLREGDYAVVVVNRVFDRGGEEGLSLIKTISDDPRLSSTPVILLSNYAASQEQAEAVGAAPGFGKSELDQPKTRQRLAAFLE